VKGLGGALLREKMVVQAARRFVVIADESKWVPRLGTRAPLPVEVVPFAWEAHLAPLRALGVEPVLREGGDAEPYRTDNGNLILDLHAPEGFPDPAELEATLRARAGVVETGFFLGVADEVVLAGAEGIRTVERPS
jgi:ribose 5-phosphate isomerase A